MDVVQVSLFTSLGGVAYWSHAADYFDPFSPKSGRTIFLKILYTPFLRFCCVCLIYLCLCSISGMPVELKRETRRGTHPILGVRSYSARVVYLLMDGAAGSQGAATRCTRNCV